MKAASIKVLKMYTQKVKVMGRDEFAKVWMKHNRNNGKALFLL